MESRRLAGNRLSSGASTPHLNPRAILLDGDRPGAGSSDVTDLVADRAEHGLDLVEGRLVSAYENAQRGAFGAHDAAAYRSVEHVNALLLKDGVDAADHRRGIGTQVDIDRAGAGAVGNAGFAPRPRPALARSPPRGHHHVPFG